MHEDFSGVGALAVRPTADLRRGFGMMVATHFADAGAAIAWFLGRAPPTEVAGDTAS